MAKRTAQIDRRRFLRGVGGVTLALPALETFLSRRAFAQAGGEGLHRLHVRAERHRPRAVLSHRRSAPLTAATMMGSAVEDLIPHAADLMVVRGINWTHGNGVGCGHSSGCNTSLTASRATGSSNRSLPTRESADYASAQLLKRDPLNLYSGKKSSYLGDAFAYGTEGKVRPADNNPFNVYSRLTGLDQAMATTPGLAPQFAARQKSVNDLVRVQLNDLLKRQRPQQGGPPPAGRAPHQRARSGDDHDQAGGAGGPGGNAELAAQVMQLKDEPDTQRGDGERHPGPAVHHRPGLRHRPDPDRHPAGGRRQLRHAATWSTAS